MPGAGEGEGPNHTPLAPLCRNVGHAQLITPGKGLPACLTWAGYGQTVVPEGMSVGAFPEQGGAKEEVGPRRRRREQALWEQPAHLPAGHCPLGWWEGLAKWAEAG